MNWVNLRHKPRWKTIHCFLILFVLTIKAANLSAQEFPVSKISNAHIQAKLYLPDSVNGYYRASRFDWSGVVYSLDYQGISYFGQWFDKHDPFLHEAIMGPVEAFDPMGYKAGTTKPFTKVGVGLLMPIDTLPYHFSKPYPIIDHGIWDYEVGEDWIVFTHTLNSGDFPYKYSKTVRLIDHKLILEHELENTGLKAVQTSVFNHNFFQINQLPIGPGYEVIFPFQIEGDVSGLGKFAEVKGNRVTYTKELSGTDRARIREIKGFGGGIEDYEISIENSIDKAGVKITADRPMSLLLLWSAPKAICPEPYIDVVVQPGEVFNWTLTYEFYTI